MPFFSLATFEFTMESKYTAKAKYLCKGFSNRSDLSNYVMIKYCSLLMLLLDFFLYYKVPKLLSALKNYLLTGNLVSSYR